MSGCSPLAFDPSPPPTIVLLCLCNETEVIGRDWRRLSNKIQKLFTRFCETDLPCWMRSDCKLGPPGSVFQAQLSSIALHVLCLYPSSYYTYILNPRLALYEWFEWKEAIGLKQSFWWWRRNLWSAVAEIWGVCGWCRACGCLDSAIWCVAFTVAVEH